MRNYITKSFAVTFVFLLYSCGNKLENKGNGNIGLNYYPKDIVMHGLQKQYDNAVWELYRFYFDVDSLQCNNRQIQGNQCAAIAKDSIINLYPKVRILEKHNYFWMLNMTLEADSLCGYCLPAKRDSGNTVDIFLFCSSASLPLYKGYGAYDYWQWVDSILIPSYLKKDSTWNTLIKEYNRLQNLDKEKEKRFVEYLKVHKHVVQGNELLYRLSKERNIW